MDLASWHPSKDVRASLRRSKGSTWIWIRRTSFGLLITTTLVGGFWFGFAWVGSMIDFNDRLLKRDGEGLARKLIVWRAQQSDRTYNTDPTIDWT
jgi:hypothetical protein